MIPRELLILGGGFVGLEFAQAMRRLGSNVTVIHRGDRLLSDQDDDVSAEVLQILENDGVEIVCKAQVCQVFGESGDAVRVTCRKSSVEGAIEGTHLLVATGRTPNTNDIGLQEAAGVTLDADGYVIVNEHLETTAEGVYAVGECNGGPQFTHVAFDDFRVVVSRLAGGRGSTKGREVPFCLFTDPEFARIGLSEREAIAANIRCLVFKIPIGLVLRTRTLSETCGFMKALVSMDTHRILGFACVGHGAGELLGSIQIAMKAGWSYMQVRDMMFTHPTMNEGLGVLFSSQPRNI